MRTSRQARRIAAILLVALARATLAAAQAGGAVSGIISDPTGAVVPGATVTLVNTSLGAQLVSTSDSAGAFAFPNVPVGRYDFLVDLDGFKPVRRNGVAVDINSRLRIDVTLEVG